ATDPDGDPLVLWADNLPPGALFDPDQRTLSWTPDFQSAGSYENVRFLASDSLHQVSAFTTILIAPGNQAPTLAKPGNLTVDEGTPIHFQLRASDAEGDRLHFSSPILPCGAVVT